MGGQGQLYEDSVNIVAPVKVIHHCQQFVTRRGLRRREFLTVNPDFLTRLHLAAHVNLGRGIVPNTPPRQPRPNTGRSHSLYFFRSLSPNLLSDLRSIQNGSRHYDSNLSSGQPPASSRQPPASNCQPPVCRS